jgi:hypothetical protein
LKPNLKEVLIWHPGEASLSFFITLSLFSSSMDIILAPSSLTLTTQLFQRTTGGSAEPELLQTNIEWEYSVPPLSRDEFFFQGILPDLTPPFFTNLAVNKEACFVRQLPGRFHSNPAFEIMYDVSDEQSMLNVMLSVGTYENADNVLPSVELGGNRGLTVYHGLAPAQQLFFTVSATNQNGLSSLASCSLPNDQFYDRSPPLGRINPIGAVSSHPDTIQALVVLFDEFGLTEVQEIAIGRLRGSEGAEILPWTSFNISQISTRPLTSEGVLDLYSFGRVSTISRGSSYIAHRMGMILEA